MATVKDSVSVTPLPRTPSFRLDGQRALVTGAGRGLGLAAAAALADAGATVTLAARSREEIEAAAQAIRQGGGKASALVLDVGDLEQVRREIETADPYQILVNNAGTNHPQPVLEVEPEKFDAVMGLNVRAAFFVAQSVAQKLKSAGLPGSIINISSQMGHVGAPARSVYCASKHAVEGMTKAMAVELGPFGIRVNTLCPTFVETPMTRPMFQEPGFRQQVLQKIKLGRVGRVEDMMGGIVFLASAASALVTGSALMIDGGWTAD